MFPKTRKELETLVFNFWNATIKRLREDVKTTEDRVTTTEEDIVIIDSEVEENTEEILATKAEVQEVRDLVVLLVQELAQVGLINNPTLLQLLNEEILN